MKPLCSPCLCGYFFGYFGHRDPEGTEKDIFCFIGREQSGRHVGQPYR